VAAVAASAAVADVAAAAPSVSGAKGTASAERRCVPMLVQAKLGGKYRGSKRARISVSRPTIGNVGKAATGTKRQRWAAQEAPKFPVLGVAIGPVLRLALDGAHATSGPVERRGHPDFVWVMDKEYFTMHDDIAIIFRHDMVAHLYLCAVDGGATGRHKLNSRKTVRSGW